jgi:hypothetical protein
MGGGGGTAPPFFILALSEGGFSVSYPSSFIPGERDSHTPWMGDWVGPRNGLDTVV